jgi:drug/metabolite transporter (DMT)-like permease
MLISVNPLWAAVMGRVLLKEKMEWPTVVALAAALGAIALVFVPSLVNDGNGGENDGSVRGDVIALVCGTCVAAFLIVNRRATFLHPQALMSMAGLTGSFLAAVLCLVPALALQLGSHVHTLEGHHAGAVHLNSGPAHAFTDLEPLFWPLILIDSGLVVGCIVTAMTLAPRYISATQVALILLLGAPLSRPPARLRPTQPGPTLHWYSIHSIRSSNSKPRGRHYGLVTPGQPVERQRRWHAYAEPLSLRGPRVFVRGALKSPPSHPEATRSPSFPIKLPGPLLDPP